MDRSVEFWRRIPQIGFESRSSDKIHIIMATKNPAPLFSRRIVTSLRVYYLDVFRDEKGQSYMAITEVARTKPPVKGVRRKIFLHAQTLEKFEEAFREVSEFISNSSGK